VPEAIRQLSHCPCGNLRPYEDCCGRFHAGDVADNAQKLMRSRYSAYVLRLEAYLLDTWHPSTRPPELHLEDSNTPYWIGLEIRSQQQNADTARIEFIARYRRKASGPIERQHEISRFVREGERWFYVEGDQPPPPRRNY
jgi:SEC-C motif-containing protein